MAVDVGGLDVSGYENLAVIAALPQVAEARAYTGFYVAAIVDGQPDLSQDFEALGSIDGRYFDQDRFTALQGRLPDPNNADEVAVNEESAKLYGYHVGQKIDFGAVSRADVESPDSNATEPLQPRLLTHATIVGVGVFIEEVIQDDTDDLPGAVHSRLRREAEGTGDVRVAGLVLRHGDADVPRSSRRSRDAPAAARRSSCHLDRHVPCPAGDPPCVPRARRVLPHCRGLVHRARWAGGVPAGARSTRRRARSPGRSAPGRSRWRGRPPLDRRSRSRRCVARGRRRDVGVADDADRSGPARRGFAGVDADWTVLGLGAQ